MRRILDQLISKNWNHEYKIQLNKANVHSMSFFDAIQVSFFKKNCLFWGGGVTAHLEVVVLSFIKN